jgi:DNA damage-binding protein 1
MCVSFRRGFFFLLIVWQRQIVTCSGGQNTGSINVMRKGADFQQLGIVSGVAHTVGIFPLRKTYDDMCVASNCSAIQPLTSHCSFDSHILISTLQHTHAFELQGSDKLVAVESISLGFAPGRTLAARNIQRAVVKPAAMRGNVVSAPERTEYKGTALVVQVTANGAFLLEFDMQSFTQIHNYDVTSRGDRPGLQVVAASINPTQTVLALSNGKLLCLELNQNTNTLDLKSESMTILHHMEASALSCTSLDTRRSASEFTVVSYWQKNHIEVLQHADGGFKSVCRTDSLSAVVRTLLMHDFGVGDDDSHPYLFAGLGDGSFAYFTWNEQTRTLGPPKLISLGNLPVCLTPCIVDGKKALFAAGTRAMVLSWERERVNNSPVMLKVNFCPK